MRLSAFPISALLQAQHFLLYLIFWRVFIKHNTISGLDTTFSLLFRYFVQINLFKVCLASTVAISTLCCQLDSLKLYFYKISRNFDKRLSWLDRLMFPSITMWFQSQFRCLLNCLHLSRQSPNYDDANNKLHCHFSSRSLPLVRKQFTDVWTPAHRTDLLHGRHDAIFHIW